MICVEVGMVTSYGAIIGTDLGNSSKDSRKMNLKAEVK